MAGRHLFRLGTAAALAVLPTVGFAQGMFLNPFEERALGEQSYESYIKKNGGRHADPKLTAYIVDLCQRIAQVTARHPDKFVFSLVKNPEPNAFATFGGFVYIQAGLLPLVNDEAELAAVLGHEVGHSINRHLAKTWSRENVAKQGYKIGLLSRKFREKAPEIKEGLMLKVIAFGRDQELESDDVGFAANGKLGLDTLGPARFFRQLQRMREYNQATYEMAEPKPAYLQTHPQHSERIARAIQLAEANGGTDLPRHRDRFLAAINGMRLDTEKGPRFVRVVTVKPGDTAQSLSRRVAMPNPVAYFLMINGLDAADEVKPGMRVKLVTSA